MRGGCAVVLTDQGNDRDVSAVPLDLRRGGHLSHLEQMACRNGSSPQSSARPSTFKVTL
jgi:hypothetical protein